MTILSLKNIVYTQKKNKMTVLEDVTIAFSTGKVYGILGKSGEGKTTLLALLAGISTVDSGSILFKEQSLERIERDQYRRKEIGTVFQQYNVLPQVTALSFLKLCADSSAKKKYDDHYFYERLKKVGIDEKLAKKPIKKLSVSNQQRVYLAKAIVNDPQIILLDEPTKSLSELPLVMVMNYLRKYAKNENKCIIVSSESKEVADYVDELWGLNGRKLSFIKDNREK